VLHSVGQRRLLVLHTGLAASAARRRAVDERIDLSLQDGAPIRKAEDGEDSL